MLSVIMNLIARHGRRIDQRGNPEVFQNCLHQREVPRVCGLFIKLTRKRYYLIDEQEYQTHYLFNEVLRVAAGLLSKLWTINVQQAQVFRIFHFYYVCV